MAVNKAKAETVQQVAETKPVQETAVQMSISTPAQPEYALGRSIYEQLLLDVSRVLDGKKKREDFTDGVPDNFGGIVGKALEVMERTQNLGNYAVVALEALEGVKSTLDKQECAATCPASMKAKVGLKKLTKMAGELYS